MWCWRWALRSPWLGVPSSPPSPSSPSTVVGAGSFVANRGGGGEVPRCWFHHSRAGLTVSRPRDTVPTNLRTETPVDGMVARWAISCKGVPDGDDQSVVGVASDGRRRGKPSMVSSAAAPSHWQSVIRLRVCDLNVTVQQRNSTAQWRAR